MTIGRIPSVEGGIQPTIVDAKGDLIAATAADTVNRLAVGSNDQVLVADSSTSTGLAWKSVATPFAAGKNKIINGDFAINQRGFTTSTTHFGYGFDRWVAGLVDGTTNSYSAQTFTPGTAPVAGYEGVNFARFISAGQTAANAQTSLRQRIEDVRTFAGQTITLSFWAKANSGTPKLAIELGQEFGSGGSSSVNNYVGQLTLSTSWARYTISYTLPSISGKTIGTSSFLALNIYCSAGSDFNSRTGSLGIQSNTFDFWGVQLESGNVATPFQTATGTLQGELAACQRYYYRYTGTGTNPLVTTNGISYSATRSNIILQHPVTMRTIPTSVEFANLNVTDLVNYNLAVSVMTLDANNSTPNFAFLDATSASGATTNRQAFCRGSAANGYIGISAEL